MAADLFLAERKGGQVSLEGEGIGDKVYMGDRIPEQATQSSLRGPEDVTLSGLCESSLSE